MTYDKEIDVTFIDPITRPSTILTSCDFYALLRSDVFPNATIPSWYIVSGNGVKMTNYNTKGATFVFTQPGQKILRAKIKYADDIPLVDFDFKVNVIELDETNDFAIVSGRPLEYDKPIDIKYMPGDFVTISNVSINFNGGYIMIPPSVLSYSRKGRDTYSFVISKYKSLPMSYMLYFNYTVEGGPSGSREILISNFVNP